MQYLQFPCFDILFVYMFYARGWGDNKQLNSMPEQGGVYIYIYIYIIYIYI